MAIFRIGDKVRIKTVEEFLKEGFYLDEDFNGNKGISCEEEKMFFSKDLIDDYAGKEYTISGFDFSDFDFDYDEEEDDLIFPDGFDPTKIDSKKYGLYLCLSMQKVKVGDAGEFQFPPDFRPIECIKIDDIDYDELVEIEE